MKKVIRRENLESVFSRPSALYFFKILTLIKHKIIIYLSLILLLSSCSQSQIPAQNPARIMPLGNSITQAQTGYNSYRRPLYKLLTNAGFTVDFIGSKNTVFKNDSHPANDFDNDHEGHWGWRTDELISGRSGEGKLSDWVKLNNPDFVLLHIGHNDIIQSIPISVIISNIESIIEIIRSQNPYVTILLAQLIPSNYSTQVAQNISTLNNSIPSIAISKSTDKSAILLVDQATGFDPKIHTYDKIHPNLEGENLMAIKWFEVLSTVLSFPLSEPDTDRKSVQVYPNLSSSSFTLSGLQNTNNVVVINSQGRIILQKPVTGHSMELDLNQYPQGMYIIKFLGRNHTVEVKNIFKIK
jgi:hypothetical protein